MTAVEEAGAGGGAGIFEGRAFRAGVCCPHTPNSDSQHGERD